MAIGTGKNERVDDMEPSVLIRVEIGGPPTQPSVRNGNFLDFYILFGNRDRKKNEKGDDLESNALIRVEIGGPPTQPSVRNGRFAKKKKLVRSGRNAKFASNSMFPQLLDATCN